MTTVAELLDGVQGMRDDAARELASRYTSVFALADATKADLQDVTGVGPVLANRVMAAARTARVEAAPAAAETAPPAGATTPSPAEPAPAVSEPVAAQPAAAETAPPLAVVEPEALPSTARPEPAPARERDGHQLPAVAELVATVVGAAAGLTVRVAKAFTRPATHLFGGLVGRVRRA